MTWDKGWSHIAWQKPSRPLFPCPPPFRFGDVMDLVVGSNPKGCPSTPFLNSSSNGTKSFNLLHIFLDTWLKKQRFWGVFDLPLFELLFIGKSLRWQRFDYYVNRFAIFFFQWHSRSEALAPWAWHSDQRHRVRAAQRCMQPYGRGNQVRAQNILSFCKKYVL